MLIDSHKISPSTACMNFPISRTVSGGPLSLCPNPPLPPRNPPPLPPNPPELAPVPRPRGAPRNDMVVWLVGGCCGAVVLDFEISSKLFYEALTAPRPAKPLSDEGQ